MTGPWPCVCGDWHTSAPHVQTDPHGRVIHAPVPDAEGVDLTT